MKKKINNSIRRQILLLVCAVAIVVILVLFIRWIGGLLGGRADTSAGLEYIRQEEAGDVSVIEEKINLLEEQDNNGEDTRSLKEKFTGAAVVGDSIAEGFSVYDVLNASSVLSKIGVHLDELDDQISQLKELKPGVIFLALGMNDVPATNGDTEAFVEEYRAVLEKIQEEVPDAHIFVNSIFPVQDKAVEEEPALEKIPDYNSALAELSDSERIGFIDNSSLVADEYYEEDGIHFKADFYPVWAEHMAEVAAL